MRRFLIEFDVPPYPPPPYHLAGLELREALLSLPWGVTGDDLDDCLTIVRDFLGLDKLPLLRRVQADIDVSTLQPTPRGIGVPVWRGIWMPAYNRQMSGRWPYGYSLHG